MSETIVAFISGAAVAVFASYLAHIFSEGRSRRKEFNQAAADFRANFIPELRYLDYRYSPDRSNDRARGIGIYKTLANAYDRHETAMIKFRCYLTYHEKIGFDKVWDDYCNKENGKPYFMLYSELYRPTSDIKNRRLYLSRLESLLTFAKPK